MPYISQKNFYIPQIQKYILDQLVNSLQWYYNLLYKKAILELKSYISTFNRLGQMTFNRSREKWHQAKEETQKWQ